MIEAMTINFLGVYPSLANVPEKPTSLENEARDAS